MFGSRRCVGVEQKIREESGLIGCGIDCGTGLPGEKRSATSSREVFDLTCGSEGFSALLRCVKNNQGHVDEN